MHLEAITDLIRLMHVKYLKDLEVKSEPSIYEKVGARLEKLPLVTQRGHVSGYGAYQDKC